MKREHLHDEDGFLLVTSITLLAIMVSVALASYGFVDSGQQRTREQRERETALNLTEGVLYSQGFALAQKWPGNATAGASMPDTCTETAQTAALQQFCPTPATLAAAQGSPATANFANVDALANVTWTTRIRDNGGPNLAGAYVSGAPAEAEQSGTNIRTGQAYTCPGPCKWDANGDRQLWVQARGVVRGKPRNVVALLKREVFTEAFARNGVTAGSFETSNQGNKTIIDSTGSQVVVRCTTATDPNCTVFNDSKGQVLPAKIVEEPAYPPAMTAAQLARFKIAAQTANPPTYYTSCPPTFTGTVVYVDVPLGTVCSDSNNAVYNSRYEPGIVIMPRGTLEMKATYFGILYLGNEQNSSGPVLTLGANAEVCGGVAIDGPGRLVAGQASSGASSCDPTRTRSTIMFQDNAFNSLATFGTTGLVQNTWRELPAS